jgi:hypothetical protein
MARPAERTLFVGTLAAMAAAVLLAYWLFFGRGPAASMGPPAPKRAEPKGAEVEVRRATGEAWLSRGGGPRVRLAVGAALRESDVIETSDGSAIELGAGDSYQVFLDGAARFGVKEITAELSRFRLEEGLAEARVRSEAGRVLVIDSSDDASVRTGGGRVTVAAGGGRVAVGVTEGEAQLGSGGQIVAVRAGQFSMAERGKAPSAAVALPRSLLLKVDWPTERETNRRRITIRGRASPGALVSVGGERVKVGPDGVFTHILFLREGQQTIDAVARDVAGRSETVRSKPVVLDTRAPDAEFDTRNLWGKRRVGTTPDAR